jgi:hypothetical protein
MRVVPGAVLLALLMAAPAQAHAQAEPFPDHTWLIPRDGFMWKASSWPSALPSQMLDFTVYLNYQDEYDELPGDVDVEVATAPEIDADGTLADAGVIDRYEADPVAGYEGIYSARTRTGAEWAARPGTYYWQATYESYEDGDEELYAGPVRALVIVAAPAPDPPQTEILAVPPAAATPPGPLIVPRPLAPGTARAVVRRAILAATHRDYRGLTYRCTTAPGAATCRPAWRNARYRYRGTLKIATGLAGISASFTGTRAVRSCARRCARPYAFTARL